MRSNRHLVRGAHPVVAAAGRDMLDREARERGSVLSSAKTCLLLFKDPVVGHNTSRCDFRLFDLMSLERPVSLYIVTRGADKERLRPVVRLLLTMAMRVLMGVELKKPVKAGDGRILAAGEMVVFVAGEPPIAGTQILYFLDPTFASRAAIPAPPSGSTFRPTIVFRTG